MYNLLSGMSSADDLSRNGYFLSEGHEEGVYNKDQIQLSFGGVAPELLKNAAKAFEVAVPKRLAEEYNNPLECCLLQYGSSRGDPMFLLGLAKFLSERYGEPVDGGNLMLTAGATVGLHLTMSVYFGEGDLVFLEDPSYFIGIKILKDMKRRVVPVPLDMNGIQVDALEKTLQEHWSKATFTPSEKKPFWAALYLVPCFHNPTGASLSEDRCRAVVRLARKYHLLVLCDDVYNLLWWGPGTHAPRRLLSYDMEDGPELAGHVVSNGSFAKILSPGVRVGWLEAPPKILTRICDSPIVCSGGGLNHLTAGFIGKIIDLGLLDPHVDNYRQFLEDRNKVAVEVLKNEFQDLAKFTIPVGGFYIWIELPDAIDTRELLSHCMSKYGVRFHPGARFTPEEDKFTNCLRISCSYYSSEKLTKGIKAIAASMRELLSTNS